MDLTPESEVSSILSQLEEIYATVLQIRYGVLPSKDIKNSFKAYWLETLADEESNGEKLEEEYFKRREIDEEQFEKDIGIDMPLLFICISTEYCVQSLKAKNLDQAWQYVSKAKDWLSHGNYIIIIEESKKEAISERARAHAQLRVEADPAYPAMQAIENEFFECPSKFEKRGYQTNFVNEQAKNYPEIVDSKSIYNKITKLKKLLGIKIIPTAKTKTKTKTKTKS